MEQSTSKVAGGSTTSASKNKGEIKGKRFGRGAVESGLTHECGVVGVIAAGHWPTNVSSHSDCNNIFIITISFQDRHCSNYLLGTPRATASRSRISWNCHE